MLQIKSSVHDYAVEEFADLTGALQATLEKGEAIYLVDRKVSELYQTQLGGIPAERTLLVTASEGQKSFEQLSAIFLEILAKGIRRDWTLFVIGGGVLQDIGCFIASVLFRGVRWELIPTTLLAQADSCIGSKSSINIGPYKNQIGTFYPPHRVLLTTDVLRTLPWEEVCSGLGEVIKLQLLSSAEDFEELRRDLSGFESDMKILAKWVQRSLLVKRPYIEADEYDRGVRNLLNYGHTFGHAYESATEYRIPHGIAVILGILTATFVSVQLGMVSTKHYKDLKQHLARWHQPFGEILRSCSRERILSAIQHDKKNTGGSVQAILTRGPGSMEKQPLSLETQLGPFVTTFLDRELW